MPFVSGLPGRLRAGEPTLDRAIKNPSEAIDRLKQGNARYAAGVSLEHDFSKGRALRVIGQKPFAAILSCADSRVAPELIFDTRPGELFVSRDAGNFVVDSTMASIEYGVAELGIPLVLVLGHSHCGAVSATIKVVESGEALPGHLPVLTDAIAPAVERVKNHPGDLLENSISSNVRLNVERIATSEPIVRPMVTSGKVRVIGGVYDISTGKVNFLT